MKNFTLISMHVVFMSFLYLTAVAQVSQAQAPAGLIGRYYWQSSIKMIECDINGVPVATDASEQKTSLVGQKFEVIDTVNKDTALLRILNYKDSARFKEFNANISTNVSDLKRQEQLNQFHGSKQKYFSVPVTKINDYATPYTRNRTSMSVGVLYFPFKYRPQKESADFSGSFNFGAALGITLGNYSYNKWSISFLTGYSISNIKLDSASVGRNSDMLTVTNDLSAFSFSFGPMVQYDRVQAGVFVGMDRISRLNHLTYGWVYQGKPWVSVGFGYSIFTIQNEKSSTDKKQ